MDKNILKKFAIESRQELMEKVSNKIKKYFVDEEFSINQNGEVYVLINGKHTLSLTKSEYDNRQLLIKRIKEITLEQVIEEAAYTWFNRIIAIRYMEIHDYLPLTKDNQSLGVRVLSSKDNTPDPEIMKISNLINPDLDINFNKEYYGSIQDNNKRFEYILLLVCKKLGKVIPQVFDGITDYIDILIPDNLLNDSGFITKVIKEVPEINFEQVEIIGWLYQYYNQSEKDRVISAKKAYKKNEIPYATQLFTPDWIVKYMVENSLGKYWIEHGGNTDLIKKWKYFIKDNIDLEEKTLTVSEVNNMTVKEFNDTLVKRLVKLDPKDIKCIDPCCGSGHILVYMFEVLFQIYESYGYSKKDIAELILKNNLYGLDIDDRAGQLSILSVILKAREYDTNVFKKIDFKQLNIVSIKETNNLDSFFIECLPDNIKNIVNELKSRYIDAKEYGSLIQTEKIDTQELIDYINKNITIETTILSSFIKPIIKQNNILAQKYNVIVTNPPYMGIRMMNLKLLSYLESKYRYAKYDLFSAMLDCWSNENKCKDYISMITPMAWAFLDSYSELRKVIIENNKIDSFLHLGVGTFGNDLGMISFVLSKNFATSKSLFINLTDYREAEEKRKNIFNTKLYTVKDSNDFKKFPGYQFGYWIPEKIVEAFEKGNLLEKYAEPRQGLATGDNDLFLRKWYEIDINKLGLNITSLEEAKESKYKWFPFNKGGNFRKWYGNNEYVINWENDGFELKQYAALKYKSYTRTIKNINYYFKKGITWSTISSKAPSFRAFSNGFIISNSGQGIYLNEEQNYYYLLGLLNTNYSSFILNFLSPTMGFESGYIRKIPIIIDKSCLNKINELVKENIKIEKEDWDSNEISWDFNKIPYIGMTSTINYQFEKIKNDYKENKQKLKNNEIILNKCYNKILQIDDIIPDNISDDVITINNMDKKSLSKNIISYAVGCMFGRYSLDKDGIVFGGGTFYKNNYKTFEVDEDNIIPITDEAYFGDDIVERFKDFIEVVYGKETLYENLDFIAETLGKRNGENSEETIRRYFINDFYNDHVKMYQKRPIYWMFDSGKKNGFKCLIYMHRYNEGLVSKIRLDYLHKIQNTYEKELKEITEKLNNDMDLTNKRELSKKQADLSSKLQETNEYDEKIAHIVDQRINIDLDDGVAVNYAKFSVKNPKTGKDESILANSKDIVKKKKEE